MNGKTPFLIGLISLLLNLSFLQAQNSGSSLVAVEFPVGTKASPTIYTHFVDLMPYTKVQVIDTRTGAKVWLKNVQKPPYLYEEQLNEAYNWLSTNDKIESSRNDYAIATTKGQASIDTKTGVLTYVPNVGVTGTDKFFYKIQCPVCPDKSQKTLELNFSTSQKTSTNIADLTEKMSIENYPNPFTEQTVINYVLEQDTRVNIKLFDGAGNLLRTLKENDFQETGTHSIQLNAKALPQGVFYIFIQTDNQSMSRKIIKM